jgi:tetratricopeptide (TPR) repeat protein
VVETSLENALRSIGVLSLLMVLSLAARGASLPGGPTSAVTTQASVEPAAPALARADEALAAGDVDAAVTFYRQAVGAAREGGGPDYARALEGLGVALLRAKNVEDAQTTLERAVQVDPDSWRAQNILGVIADMAKKYDAARKHYSAALVLRPNSPSILNNRGYSSYLAGDFDAAEDDLLAAVASDENYAQAWRNLGLLCAHQRKYGFALKYMSRVMSRYAAANNVGYIAMQDGDYDSADILFAESLRLSPGGYEPAEKNAEELKRRRAQGTADEIVTQQRP